MMRRLVLPLVLQVLVFTRQVAAQYCYTDSYGNYSCDSFYLSIAARWAIGVGCLVFVCLIFSIFFMRRRRQIAARNAILLQNQRPVGPGNQWIPPPGQLYGAGGYPMQPPNPGYGGPPQPFQPGYMGGYTGGGEAPKGYDVTGANPNNVQEPPRSYNPEQPNYNYEPPPPAAETGYPTQEPPSYSGFSPPSGAPIGGSGTTAVKA